MATLLTFTEFCDSLRFLQSSLPACLRGWLSKFFDKVEDGTKHGFSDMYRREFRFCVFICDILLKRVKMAYEKELVLTMKRTASFYADFISVNKKNKPSKTSSTFAARSSDKQQPQYPHQPGQPNRLGRWGTKEQ